MSKFYSTKTFGNDRGLSCVFRQWRATHSHCSLLHGYSIGVKFTFECDQLDERNWVFDFGGFKEIKKWLEHTFDHTTVVASDDPSLSSFIRLREEGLLDLRVVDGVGCEKFAELIFKKTEELIKDTNINPSARLYSVEVFEHDANSAIYKG